MQPKCNDISYQITQVKFSPLTLASAAPCSDPFPAAGELRWPNFPAAGHKLPLFGFIFCIASPTTMVICVVSVEGARYDL